RRGKSLAAPAPSEAARTADGGGAADPAAPASELDERMRRVERADQLRNLLVSKMSHDIRTPLNSVITLSQLLNEGNAGPLSLEQRRYVEIIHRNGQMLLGLVNDILDLANLEAGRFEIDIAPFDLRALARGVADGCNPTAQKKGLPLQ